MQAYQVFSAKGFEDIRKIEIPQPQLASDEILVQMRACSLNYRDLLIPQGGYLRNDNRPIIPLSDGAGKIVKVGGSVKSFKIGDRVVGNFFQDWVEGLVDEKGLQTALGGGINGTLAECFVLKAQGAVRIPDQLSYEEAATLPCAAVTAWHGLVPLGNIQKGETILTQGTGGVSIFGLQLAKALGANVIITSSSDEKLQLAKKLGADHTINYVKTPNWDQEVLKITDGKGVDLLLELGGEKTFEKSINATKVNGSISIIGILSGFDIPINLTAALNVLRLNGVHVGSVEMFNAMNQVIVENNIKPVIDKVFDFNDVLDAYRYLEAAEHFGKIVISKEP